MAENILNKTGQNALEGADKQLYKSTGGILGKPNKYARPWPQTNTANKGFLPISTISPFIGGEDPNVNQDKLTQFEIKDWRGRLLTSHPGSEVFGFGTKFFDTIDKMRLSKLEDGEFPISSEKLDENRYVMDPSGFTPYSNRDIYKIFNDTSTDYFKHGIYIDRNHLTLQGDKLTSTPEENNDPVIFGFDLIIDTVGSPLLNGAIDDFINQFQSITEIATKMPVYQDFKKQFIKLFKTNSDVDFNKDLLFLLKNNGNDGINKYANADSVGSYLEPGKKAYMSYYLKKIGGLKNLSESNGSDSFKYLTDYKKDLISLTFLEDVSLTLGTLANLYKLLYWSKPNGKSMIPENLLKFNCKIVVSELRNFSRVKASGLRVDVIKDNLSRYVYDLKECQLFFDTLPHSDEVSNVDTSVFEDYSVNFNYKFSSMSFERFNPKEGRYHIYNNGGMWDSNGKETIRFGSISSSISGNGIDKEVIIKNYGHDNFFNYNDPEIIEEVEPPKEEKNSLQKLKEASKKKAIKAGNIVVDNVRVAAQRKLQSMVNTQVSLLNQSVNKVLNAVAGTQGIKPPTNVYDNGGTNGIQQSRFFYDVRGQLADFAGDSISGILGGG
jgi:hypothetical protein